MTTTPQRFGRGTAVVTGAGCGLGEALAEQLCGHGMAVVVADADAGRAGTVARRLRAHGGRAEARTVDVADPAAVEDLAVATYAEHGSVDLLLNNAGVELGGRVWEIDPVRWRRLMSVNIDGVFHGVRAFLPRMLTRGAPAIVANVASVGSVTTPPRQSAYVASKHAVLGFTECLHRELAEIGAPVQVSAVLPSWVRTRIFEDALAAGPAGAASSHEHLSGMSASMAAQGLAPADAAARILDGIARGDFWVFTDPQRGPELRSARGRLLLDGEPPAG
ncbi:SDR family NAD(P)-dependent oxidoreductase [Prauserella halophila]|uniref:SDR family NAD(P)-dependent oxidoreductase n=1 Tax=Prauserella halophila TaxID=185641 RepID=A0ABN1W2G7_9PSEU|nr:SDR family NAD(P)-dependent oxidoreductase [Prauserella halophila]MCP2237411.1 hypothetical protein [Prauserella halophila]